LLQDPDIAYHWASRQAPCLKVNVTLDLIATPAESTLATEGAPRSLLWAKLRRGTANVGIALLFFGAISPGAVRYGSDLANAIWVVGALLMGTLTLVRVPASSATLDAPSIIATTAMLVPPMLVRPGEPTVGILAFCAIVLEIVGVIFSQVARIYLGRRFALLPANRGIVTTGPFRFMRHPIYSGWLIVSIGYLMAYPAVGYGLMILLLLPIMMWRISLEEKLLLRDPAYQAYCNRTPWRLIPGLL